MNDVQIILFFLFFFSPRDCLSPLVSPLLCLTNKRIKSILWLRRSRVSSSFASLLTTDEKARGFVLGSDESIAVNPLSISYRRRDRSWPQGTQHPNADLFNRCTSTRCKMFLRGTRGITVSPRVYARDSRLELVFSGISAWNAPAVHLAR